MASAMPDQGCGLVLEAALRHPKASPWCSLSHSQNLKQLSLGLKSPVDITWLYLLLIAI